MTLPSWNEVVEQWPLCCAKCGHAPLQASPGSLVCPACTAAFPIRDHIAALLDLDANPDLREFTLGYQDIRRAEGYTGRGAAHYQALPDYPEGGGRQPDLGHPTQIIRAKNHAVCNPNAG